MFYDRVGKKGKSWPSIQLQLKHPALGYVHGFLPSKALSAAAAAAAAEIWPEIIMPQVQCHVRGEREQRSRSLRGRARKKKAYVRSLGLDCIEWLRRIVMESSFHAGIV